MIICQLCLDFGLIFHCSLLLTHTLPWQFSFRLIIMSLANYSESSIYVFRFGVSGGRFSKKRCQSCRRLFIVIDAPTPRILTGSLFNRWVINNSFLGSFSRRWRPYGSYRCPNGVFFGPRNGHLKFAGKESFGTSKWEGITRRIILWAWDCNHQSLL